MMASMAARLGIRQVEKWLVILIAAHSVIIGLILIFATRWGANLGGWPEVVPLFFARQGGTFHIVVAAGYLIEYHRHRSVTFLLVTKILAVAFLTGTMVAVPASPWAVPLSALADGLMALVVYLVHRRVLISS
jgi:hypothetical protein